MGSWTAILSDTQAFLLAVRWDRPALLGLGLVPLFLLIISRQIRRRERQRRARLGTASSVETLLIDRPPRPKTVISLAFAAWLMMVIALAGPRWGEGESDGIAIGRDFALVIDFSRSMRADDMPGGNARWQVAVASAASFADQLRRRGGHRISLTIFAARPVVMVPLTTDYDHIRRKLGELDGRFPPAEIRPDREDAPSGTRIGAGVAKAAGTFDDRSGATGDLVLWSDGDDPADDREWRLAVQAARQAARPIHVVAVGNPDVASLIPMGNAPLEFQGPNGVPDLVRTKRHDEILSVIAVETRGEFLELHRQPIDWETPFRRWLDGRSTRELTEPESSQLRNRAGLFHLAGAILMTIAWAAHLRWGPRA